MSGRVSGPSTRAADLRRLVNVGLGWMALVCVWPAIAAGGVTASNVALLPVMAIAAISLEQVVVVLVARALGDRVLAVVLGVGPQVYGRRFGAVHVSWRALPALGGASIVTARLEGQRARTAIAMFAGVAVLAAAMLAVVAIEHPTWQALGQGFTSRTAPDVDFLLVAAFVIYANGFSALGIATRIRVLTSIDEANLRTRRKLGLALEAERSIHKGAYDDAVSLLRRGLEDWPDDPVLLVDLAVALGAQEDPEGFAVAEALVKRELSAPLRPLALNAWAWACYLRGSDELCDEADCASRAALEARPDHPSFLDTRGHVLLWNGRHAEAEQHLRRAYDRAKHRHTRATAAAGLAMVFAATDRPGEAAAWLERARREGVQSALVARAVAIVEPLRR